MADTFSFLSSEPSTYHIDALKNSELLMIILHGFEEMVDQIPVMEYCFRKFQNNIIFKEKRLITSLNFTAEVKFLRLSESSSTMVHRIPQNQIASYLGITPETLSRIRKTCISGLQRID